MSSALDKEISKLKWRQWAVEQVVQLYASRPQSVPPEKLCAVAESIMDYVTHGPATTVPDDEDFGATE